MAIGIRKQLVGTWALVECEIVALDCKKSPLVLGSNPADQYIFTNDGHFSFQAVAEFSKFASNDRMNTTPKENEAVVYCAYKRARPHKSPGPTDFLDTAAPVTRHQGS